MSPSLLDPPQRKLHKTLVFSGHSWGWTLLGVYLLLTQPSNQTFIPMSRATWCHQVLSLCWVLPGNRTWTWDSAFSALPNQLPLTHPLSNFQNYVVVSFYSFFAFVDLWKGVKVSAHVQSALLTVSIHVDPFF